MSTKYTKELLEIYTKHATSYSHLTRLLKPTFPGVHLPHIRQLVKVYKIDISHFTGKTQPKNAGKRFSTWQDILVHADRTTRKPAWALRKALKEYGREYKCVSCGNIGEWNGKKLVLEVDHIDHDWQNNKPENLQFLCPNCHSQKPKKLNR